VISISALNKALPISGLEPETVADVHGLIRKADGTEDKTIEFLEPPAGQHVPYVDPVRAMVAIFLHRGLSENIAAFCAETEYAELRTHLGLLERVRFYDNSNPNPPEYVPAPLLMGFLRERRLASDDLVNYLEKVIAAVTVAPIFQGPENWKECWSLAQLPEYKSPESMIEFFPGPPWGESSAEWRNGRFPRWRKEMRVVAADLQKVLGESVYHFSNPDSDADDDNVHRFLVLHLCCTLRPESLYVQFLLEASGAGSVEEFMAAMVNPESYAEPFKIVDAFIGLESRRCRLDYTPLTPR
jgi:hypothetical protein